MVEAARLDLDALGERIRRARAQRRLSLNDLAGKAGVSRSMLSAVERGSKAPTVLVLDRIATGLDTTHTRVAEIMVDACGAKHLTPDYRPDNRPVKSSAT